MARRKPQAAPAGPVAESDAEPPLELVRCPWTRWDSTERTPARFEEWLRERQRWRVTHTRPLPGLFARDRLALRSIGSLDREVVRTEAAAPQASPEWVRGGA